MPGRGSASSEQYSVVRQDVHFETGTSKDYTWSGAVTAQTVWDPTSGKRFVVTDIHASITTACTLILFDNTDAAGNYLTKGSYANTSSFDKAYSKPYVSSAQDNILKITTGGGAGTVTVWGYEIDRI